MSCLRPRVVTACLLLPFALGACQGTDAACRRGPLSATRPHMETGVHGAVTEGFGGGAFGGSSAPGGGMADMMTGGGMGDGGPPDGGFGNQGRPPPDMETSPVRCGSPPNRHHGAKSPEVSSARTYDDVDVEKIRIGGKD
ncbi:hypothetical protein [Novacetimonas hansenii]|uniref:hypothetical protein n=1 Tax=Novacetimonas hansenii TaxID=436 RepID=UPI00248E4D10|nr:hypothetical protein [Novacetimonas hansenii]